MYFKKHPPTYDTTIRGNPATSTITRRMRIIAIKAMSLSSVWTLQPGEGPQPETHSAWAKDIPAKAASPGLRGLQEGLSHLLRDCVSMPCLSHKLESREIQPNASKYQSDPLQSQMCLSCASGFSLVASPSFLLRAFPSQLAALWQAPSAGGQDAAGRSSGICPTHRALEL